MLTTATAIAAAAIITQQTLPMRAEPRDSAQTQAVLVQGELVEVRGRRLNYLQVYDYKRERGGYVRADQVYLTRFSEAEAPELLAYTRLVRQLPHQESLGISYAAAYLKAAPVAAISGAEGIEVMTSIGVFADRLAQRASSPTVHGKSTDAHFTAQIDTVAQLGVHFKSFEIGDRMQICYDGELYRRVLAMRAQPEQQAVAALSLTNPTCTNPDLSETALADLESWRYDVLAKVSKEALPEYLRNRLALRQASLASSLSFRYQRQAILNQDTHQKSQLLMQEALQGFSSVAKMDLADEDQALYNDTAMRLNAGKWAAEAKLSAHRQDLRIEALPGKPGETCVSLLTGSGNAATELAKRCTYGLVWSNSTSKNREQTALSLSVQQMPGWAELWLFIKNSTGWELHIVPPASFIPTLGYAEFAGWVPGGKEMLIAREARGEGKYRRTFELIRLDTLATQRFANDPALLGAFQRWQDPNWKRTSLSVR